MNPPADLYRFLRELSNKTGIRLGLGSYAILALINEGENSPSRITEALECTFSQTTGYLVRLEQAGLIKRRKKGRRVTCTLTTYGKNAIKEHYTGFR